MHYQEHQHTLREIFNKDIVGFDSSAIIPCCYAEGIPFMPNPNMPNNSKKPASGVLDYLLSCAIRDSDIPDSVYQSISMNASKHFNKIGDILDEFPSTHITQATGRELNKVASRYRDSLLTMVNGDYNDRGRLPHPALSTLNEVLNGLQTLLVDAGNKGRILKNDSVDLLAHRIKGRSFSYKGSVGYSDAYVMLALLSEGEKHGKAVTLFSADYDHVDLASFYRRALTLSRRRGPNLRVIFPPVSKHHPLKDKRKNSLAVRALVEAA
jgi:hypothetical protein